MAAEKYEAFIDEAFIKPIRSVLIVDDDYPTLEDMLSGKDDDKDWRKNRESVKKVIASLRGQGRNLLIDIHDAKNVGAKEEIDTASHLHQSDLLVLDFQLDKSKEGDGTIAVKILRRLMTNPHFNLVVVHTSEELPRVFNEVVFGMLPPDGLAMTQEDVDRAEELIAARNDAEAGFGVRLSESFDAAQYLEIRRFGLEKCNRRVVKGEAPFAAFHGLCHSAGWPRDDVKLIFRYVLFQASKRLMKYEPDAELPPIDWSTTDVKWIRSQSVFVAFASKRLDEPPMAELSEALASWGPDPSRLYLAHLRHEIDERGTAEQAMVLGNTHALTGWYHQMLSANGEETRRHIEQTVGRLAESFMGPVTEKVADFAERLIEFDRKRGNFEATCKGHFGVDLATEENRYKAMGQHNSVVSTKKREGWHLTTGHIFKIGGDHWVCASPACDMVPSQLSNFRKDSYPNCMPFAAIRLQSVPKLKNAVEMANSTRVLFMEVEKQLEAFCFNDPSDETSAPHWTLLFAEGNGQFKAGTFDFNLVHMGPSESGLVAVKQQATVVSQLRYEYALNLVQRLGVSMTRIGLDFQSIPKAKSSTAVAKKDSSASAKPADASGLVDRVEA